MTAARTPDEILSLIPGWHGATWEALRGGLTNTVFRVSKNGNSGILKIDDRVRSAPFNSRLVEKSAQDEAAREKLAPRVLYADERVILTEFVEGAVWTRSSLERKDNLERLVDALKRLHALPLTGRTFNTTMAAQHYVDRIADPDAKLVELCMSIIENTRLPQDLRCCHNDLVVENMITTPDLMFLDWEYACDNEPLFDLATVAEHHELTEAQIGYLLNTYVGGNGERWRPHLARQQRLYLALLWLWMASRAQSDPCITKSVADRLFTSCS